MYVNEEDVPLIAPNRVVVSNRPRIWKFITASVVMSAVGFAVVSINGRNASTNPANSALSEEKTIMMKKGTLRYGDLSDVEKSSLFATFKADFERKYETVLEETTRFGHFQNSLIDIDDRNTKEQESGGSAVHGVTPFSDLSSAEFKTKYLGFKVTDSKKKSTEKVTEDVYMGSVTSVDWTGTLTTPVKDQGYCGSCWAFSTAEQIESDAIRAGILTTSDYLSVQQIVSCDTVSNGVSIYYSNYGCDGGFTETAYEYIMKAGGLTTEALYPYSSYYASSGTCNTAATDYAVKVSNFHVLDSETSMESHLLSTGPLSVCLDASLWSSYSSGIVKNCGKSIDHCVQVTGINLDEGYYTVRNSWGTKWGESGFIYLSTGSDTCGITYSPTFTEVAKA